MVALIELRVSFAPKTLCWFFSYFFFFFSTAEFPFGLYFSFLNKPSIPQAILWPTMCCPDWCSISPLEISYIQFLTLLEMIISHHINFPEYSCWGLTGNLFCMRATFVHWWEGVSFEPLRNIERGRFWKEIVSFGLFCSPNSSYISVVRGRGQVHRKPLISWKKIIQTPKEERTNKDKAPGQLKSP